MMRTLQTGVMNGHADAFSMTDFKPEKVAISRRFYARDE
jgi:hypothetical protein